MKNKLQIMKNRPSVTDEEIRSYMNFNAVADQYKARKKTEQTWIRNASVVLGVAGISILVYLYWPKVPALKDSNTPLVEQPVIADSIQTQTQQISPDTDEMNQAVENDKNETVQSKTIKKSPDVQEESDAPAFQYFEAEPVDGYPHLYEYFAREIRYPSEALKDSIQGIVSVSFLIDKEGKPVQIKIINSLGPAFDQEAQRLIENMPAWKPATLNGNPVSAKVSLPFTFQIINANPEKK